MQRLELVGETGEAVRWPDRQADCGPATRAGPSRAKAHATVDSVSFDDTPSRTRTISTIGSSDGCNSTSSAARTSPLRALRVLQRRKGAHGDDARHSSTAACSAAPTSTPPAVVLLFIHEMVDVPRPSNSRQNRPAAIASGVGRDAGVSAYPSRGPSGSSAKNVAFGIESRPSSAMSTARRRSGHCSGSRRPPQLVALLHLRFSAAFQTKASARSSQAWPTWSAGNRPASMAVG